MSDGALGDMENSTIESEADSVLDLLDWIMCEAQRWRVRGLSSIHMAALRVGVSEHILCTEKDLREACSGEEATERLAFAGMRVEGRGHHMRVVFIEAEAA